MTVSEQTGVSEEPKSIFQANGKTAVVTGANIGIGYNTAIALSKNGYKVILACRDAAKASAAVREIMKLVQDADLEFSLLNLASLSSVEKFSERLLASNKKIDLLVNNAAVMAIPKRILTDDGFEMQFATNHLGHFAITARLMPLLTAAENARVVTVSSIAHKYGKVNVDDLQSAKRYEGWSAYGTTKLANLLFAYELARRASAQKLNLISVAAHPGVSKTNILNSGPRMGMPSLRTYVSDVFAAFWAQSEADGALPIIHACLEESVRNGNYYGPDGFMELSGKPTLVQSSNQSKNEELARRLWEKSEQLSNLKLL